jgi:hypothetical protein
MKRGPAKETIQIAVLDSVLYGAARAFEYLGERGQGMLDRIGEGIVDYCTRKGYLDESASFEDLNDSLNAFFEENGYFRVDITEEGDTVAYAFRNYQYVNLEKKLQQKGNELLACPWCIAGDALIRRKGSPAQTPGFVYVSREQLPDGFIRRYKVAENQKTHVESEKRRYEAAEKIGQIPPGMVGLPAFEAVEYGLARGFEYLGAQAQLFLDDSADGIIEFLHEEFRLPSSQKPKQTLDSLASFYASRWLADKIDVSLSSSTLDIVFTNYRYASVLKELLDDGTNLISCPFTLATRSILRGDGLAAGETKWKIEDDRNVVLMSQLAKIEGQEFDEDRVARMMDSIART